jgi:putative hemolysin
MSLTGLFWLLSTVFWTFVMSFYSMQEMACISVNRLRLEFLVRSGSRRAVWVQELLNNPSVLFGTTLIGVNLALVISSESMRQFFCTLGINPNLAPLVNAPYVLIVGELIPMFAARLFPEYMARVGSPLLWVSSKIFAPIAILCNFLFERIRTFCFGDKPVSSPHLQREELRELIEVHRRGYVDEDSGALESVVGRMFALRDKLVSRIMIPLAQVPSLSSSALCAPSRIVLRSAAEDLAVVRNRQNRVIGYVWGLDIANAPDSSSVGSVCRSATFIGDGASAIDALFHLKKDRADVAFSVGSGGNITGVLTLYDILEEVTSGQPHPEPRLHIDRTVFGDTRVAEFSQRYHLSLPVRAKTFAALVEELLGHKPSVNDVARCGPLELTVTEVGILGAKTIHIHTID